MRLSPIILLLGGSLLADPCGGEPAPADARVAQYYEVKNLPLPTGIDPEIGGLNAMPNGDLVATFHHGEVAFYSPSKRQWRIFAEGLHEPLGVLPEADGSVLVMQRPELTRLRDTKGAGVADRYETVWDGFGMSGNYHEFAFGPVRGPHGKLYVALNLASNGAPVREEIRGRWIDIGLPRGTFYEGDWESHADAAGRMYSRVPYRGWVMEIDEATGVAVPYACGFRSPDGIGFDPDGRLIVNDNQGDWRGTNEFHYVVRGGFYGHPASLVWRKDWDGSDPLKVPIARLDAMRTVPAIEIPYETYSMSATGFAVIPKSPAWGALGGQLICGEMNFPRLIRLLPEEVDGLWQGACVFLADTGALKLGSHRLTFIGDTLYVGHIHLSWVGAEGITALTPTGKIPFEVAQMHATPRGFRFAFTRPLLRADAERARWRARRYFYAYHAVYGSPEMEPAEVRPSHVALGADRTSAEVGYPRLEPGWIYDFDLGQIQSDEGKLLLNPKIAYTVNRVPRASPP